MPVTDQAVVQPDKATRWKWRAEDQVTAAFSAAFVTLLIVCWYTVGSVQELIAASDWLARTYNVIGTIAQTSNALTQAESSVRGYVITGDTAFISQRDDAISQLESTLQNLKQLVAGNAAQLSRIARLETLLADDRETLNSALVARQTQGFGAAETVVANGVLEPHYTLIRDTLSQLQAVERTQLNQREGDERHSTRRLFLLGALLILVALTVITAGLWHLRRELAERRRLLRLVEDNEQFLDSVIEHIPSMLFVKDAATLRCIRLNRAGEALLGMARDTVLGRNAFDLFPLPEAQAFDQADRKAIAGDNVLDIPAEVMTTRHQGDRTVHTRKLVIRDNAGRPAYLLGICDDITDRIANERRIVELNTRLELQKAELEMSNKDLESFSYSVSHDLRAPLRAVDSFAQMLQEDYGQDLCQEAKRYISVIRDGAQKMGRLIDDLLTFSRFGRLNFRLARVDMTALAKSAAKELLANPSEQMAALQIQELPASHGDASVLCQVWSNLLSNALKYSAKRPSPTVEVSGEINGREAVYHVRDNGAGFDMRYYGKLFGVFQRLHRAEEFSGTGVGLAIVHRIITRHGGRVWAEATPDAGAAFHFSLPIGEGA